MLFVSDLDDEFLAVASQVPTDYMDVTVEARDETTLVGVNNLNGLLADMSTCIHWIAWIGGDF